METQTFDLPEELLIPEVSSTPPASPGDKQNCPSCGKLCSVNKDGSIRAHKCGDAISVSTKGKSRSKVPAKKDIPANVKRVGVPAIASGIEFLASRTVANIVPCDPKIVPAEISDADEMIGPIVRFLWPQLPAKAQSVVSSVCDHEDLIICALGWADYFKTLNNFTMEAKRYLAQQAKEAAQNQPARNLTVVNGDNEDGISGQTSATVAAGNGPAGWEPFSPQS